MNLQPRLFSSTLERYIFPWHDYDGVTSFCLEVIGNQRPQHINLVEMTRLAVGTVPDSGSPLGCPGAFGWCANCILFESLKLGNGDPYHWIYTSFMVGLLQHTYCGAAPEDHLETPVSAERLHVL